MSQDEKQEGNEGLPILLKHAFAFVDSVALKCAIELGIADIINSHGRPISLSEIGSHIKSPSSPNLTCLSRVMQVLVRGEIFTSKIISNTNNNPNYQQNETLYWLTPASRLILQDIDHHDLNYAPMVLMHNHPKLWAPCHYLSEAIKEGGVAFEKAHGGLSIWELLSIDPEFNKVFHDGLACTAKIGFRAIASEYKHVFEDVTSVVDVGGGTGAAVNEIVRADPHIELAINFDLPHVISIAPKYPGVTHVEGDMFKAIPNVDLVILKSILHDWGDEDCVKILKNCRKAIPGTKGKLILFEQLAQQEGERAMDDTVSVSDLLMIMHTGTGKERTELECKKLLEKAGFPRYNLISGVGLPSIIEAYPI